MKYRLIAYQENIKKTLEYDDSSSRRSVQPIDHIWFE